MAVAVPLTLALLAWSAVGNLVLGDTAYTARNLALTVVLLLVARHAALPPTALGLGRDRLAAGVRWGAGAVVVVAGALVAAVALADTIRPVEVLLSDQRAAGLGAGELVHHALVRIPLGTALFEEVAFRGVLLAVLLRTVAIGAAIAWSSAVFGLWHVAPTMVTLGSNDVALTSTPGLAALVGAVVVTTIAGVVFCLLRLASGSLLAPVLAHWATNALGLLAAAQRHGATA